MENILEITDLPVEELTSILRQGAILRLPHLESRLLQAKEHVNRFEAEYGTTLETLRTRGLPDDADYNLHEDFIEWEYWDDVLEQTRVTVRKVKAILSKTGEKIGAR